MDNERSALIVIDVQVDFLPGGSLAVPDGDAVIPVINRLGTAFHNIVLTQDWHPAGHISFASTHGKQPFSDTIEAPYGTQSLWPDHTIQDRPGAALAPGLSLPHASMVLRKGFRQHIDSYSAFLENDHRTSTGLAGFLRERGITHVYLCGLATDYCVGYSAMDARSLCFDVTVIGDAVRGISPTDVEAMHKRWHTAGIETTTSARLL